MAHAAHKYSGVLRHELTLKDLMRYICIAVIGLLGIAGILQGIAGSSSVNLEQQEFNSSTSVYGK